MGRNYHSVREVAAAFEREVPEYASGTIELVAVAREAGLRCKVAVTSNDPALDPVAACVGDDATRIRAIVAALNGEPIDIVPFSADPAHFVCNAIAPARVSRVFLDDDNHSMELIVADEELPKAQGANLQLAAELTGWNLSVISESTFDGYRRQLGQKLSEFATELVDALFRAGYTQVGYIASARPEELVEHADLALEDALHVVEAARAVSG